MAYLKLFIINSFRKWCGRGGVFGCLMLSFVGIPHAEIFFRAESINLPISATDRQIQIKVFGKFSNPQPRDIAGFQLRFRFQPNEVVSGQAQLVYEGTDPSTQVQAFQDPSKTFFYYFDASEHPDTEPVGWMAIRAGAAWITRSGVPSLSLQNETHIATIRFTLKGGIPSGTTKTIEIKDYINPNPPPPPLQPGDYENIVVAEDISESILVIDKFPGTILIGSQINASPAAPRALRIK